LTIAIPPGSSINERPASMRPATQPALIIPPGPPIDSLEHLSRHSFSVSTIHYVVGSVLGSSLSLLATIKTLDFFFPEQARQGYVPHPTSGRMWLLRLGYYRLHEPVEPTDDWFYLLDHAIQIGKHRFLGIIGIRLSKLPPVGECLKLTDMRPIALLPVEKSSQEIVYQQLETLRIETGITPQGLLSDGGSDLTGGITRFCTAHPSALGFGDLPHQAALLLKKRLKDDERWSGFIKQATQTKFETLQTELAFLVPPTLKSKARYMNLQSLLGWAQRILVVLDDPTLIPSSFSSDERLQAKFAWLTEYRSDVQLWCSWLAITDASLDLVRRGGYCEATSTAIEPLLEPHCDSDLKRTLASELIVRVERECSKVPSGSRMPGSTEILKSSFGKLKSLEGSQSKSGFTSFILVWAALFGTTMTDTIKAAMLATPTKLVHRWVRENLGLTVQSKRTQLARILRLKLTENQQDP
jgi:hypothetical protein